MTIPATFRNSSQHRLLSRYLDLRDSGEGEKARMLEDRLIRSYERLVKFVAYRRIAEIPGYVVGVLDRDDLFAVGLVGLQKALRNYDPDRGAAFKTHAINTIRWEIAAEFAKLDPLSDHARKIVRKAEAARHRLTAELEREPEDCELAGEIGITPEQAAKLRIWYSRAIAASLDDEEAPEVGATESEAVEDDKEIEGMRQAMREAVECLPEAEREAMTLRLENLNYAEIGEELDMSRDAARWRVLSGANRLKRNLIEAS